MSQVHHEWLMKWQREVQEEYDRLHKIALADPQRSGHGGEATWVRLLEEWLPPTYGVGTRKYILPEEGDESFETDIVVFNPGYPEKLRQREEVASGGVAAAFSVKLTADAGGIRDAVERAALLQRGMKVRNGSPRTEVMGPFAVGLLAHSHDWKKPGSKPRENLHQNLWDLDHELARHPRETLDLLCIADLTTVSTMRMPYIPPQHLPHLTEAGVDVGQGLAVTAMTMANEEDNPSPVAILICSLIIRLSYADPSLLPFADGLRLTNTLGSGAGSQRHFPIEEVFTPEVAIALPRRGFTGGDWAGGFI